MKITVSRVFQNYTYGVKTNQEINFWNQKLQILLFYFAVLRKFSEILDGVIELKRPTDQTQTQDTTSAQCVDTNDGNYTCTGSHLSGKSPNSFLLRKCPRIRAFDTHLHNCG